MAVISRSRWIASCGTRQIGRSTRSRRSSGPVAPRRATRPDSPRSRSSHEFRSAPPYTSTASCWQPTRPASGCGLIRRLGLSVWAPIIRNPVAGGVLRRGLPGDQAAAALHEVTAGSGGPRIDLGEGGEAGCLEASGGLRTGVEGRGRGVDVGQHPAGVHRPSLPGSGSRWGGPGPITRGNGRRRGIAAMAEGCGLLRKLNVRTRLVAVIAVPLALLLAVAVPEAIERRGQADDADRAAGATEQVADVSAAVDAAAGRADLVGGAPSRRGSRCGARRSRSSARSPTTP